jgi:hypothetical protein
MLFNSLRNSRAIATVVTTVIALAAAEDRERPNAVNRFCSSEPDLLAASRNLAASPAELTGGSSSLY